MDMNASLIDQRLSGIVEQYPHLLTHTSDAGKKKSSAFVLLCMATVLDISLEEAADYFTDGGNDAGIDGLRCEPVNDGEFCITVFQAKYSTKLDGVANFPENSIIKAIDTIGTLFDPDKKAGLNPKLAPKIEEIRSLIRDGYVPVVHFILCNNGLRWTDQAQLRIDQAAFPRDQVIWRHVNHDTLVDIMKSTKKVDASLRLSGKAIEENFNFKRVLLGKVAVEEVAALLDTHGDLLLERNIRRFLGLHGNRVNNAISRTLRDAGRRDDFYFFNNGITIICKKFRHNALQGDNFLVKMEDLQIINGGQTSKTIQETLNTLRAREASQDFARCYVLVRIYELAEDDSTFVHDITYATNSQNPVDLQDLHSNDDIQKNLELGMRELGYTYKRHRADTSTDSLTITSSSVAEAVLAVWRHAPHQARFMRNEYFGKLYDKIFTDLNAAEAVTAVLILRKVENLRKRPTMENPPAFLPYASQYIAMLMKGMFPEERITLQNFQQNFEKLERSFDAIYIQCIESIGHGLQYLYRGDVSLQQLSATFRRGDLMEVIFKAALRRQFPIRENSEIE